MKLYIIRHGESEGNADQRIQGRKDYPLTEKGKEQAKKIGTWLETQNIDVVYTSPARRARETADIISHITKIPIVHDDRLQPIDMGILEVQQMETLSKEMDDLWQSIKAMEDTHTHGGESINDVIERVRPFLTELANEHAKHSVCIVTHNMVKRALVKILLAIPTPELSELRFPNTAVSVFEITNGSVTATQLNISI
jgi:probable phosphoglycerate mutase